MGCRGPLALSASRCMVRLGHRACGWHIGLQSVVFEDRPGNVLLLVGLGSLLVPVWR